MSLPFDDNQRRAIRVDRNAVVTAGAGSGKTAVLSERFLWLLSERGAAVDQILALTFTQKAAAEMYERIYQRLRAAGESLRPALESFDRSQISTLDSFCAEIVRSSCGRYGLPSDFRYDEQAVQLLARETSLDFLLENLREPAIAQLIRIQGFESLWQGLLADLAFRHFRFAPRLDFPAMVEAQLARCRHDLDRRLPELVAHAHQLLAIEPRVKTLQSNQQAVREIAALEPPVTEGECGQALAVLEALSLRKSGSSTAADLQEMNALIDAIRPQVDEAKAMLHTLERGSLLREVFALLEAFQTRFVEAKRMRGLVTFQDVAELAVDILLHDHALRRFYKRRFRHILIDEFQDNNRLQRDLLFLLAERPEACGETVPSATGLEQDKLFFVGDEKQSIYRFRGADVRVFKSLHREIEQAGGHGLELDSNYRSEPGLVAFFNRLFAGVLAAGQAAAAGAPAAVKPPAPRPGAPKPFEARFQRMQPGRPAGGRAAQVHLFVKPPTEDPGGQLAGDREAEAHAVARFVCQAVENRALVVGRPGERRPADYDDFAVLLRSTGNQMHYERMFRSFGVPYATQNLRSLFLEAPISDFYLLLQLAVYPRDRQAYAGFLRSPFVNLSDETLVRLLVATPRDVPAFDTPSGREASSAPESPDAPGNTASMELSPAGSDLFPAPWISDPAEREKLRRALAAYRFVREHADRLPLAELVHRLWYRFGYRHLILSDPRYHPYLEFYEYLLRLAEAADRRGEPLVRFLEFLRRNLGRYERLEELEGAEGRGRGVQLLTIHKAKGLEFPVVVLADTGNMGRRGRSGQAYYWSEELGVAVNLGKDSYVTRLGEAEAAEQEQAEIKRLLYVACTRAMDHLVLSGSLGRRSERSPRAHLGLLLAALGLSEAAEEAPQAADEREGYRLELHRIEDLPRSEWYAGAAAGKALPLERVRPLYQGAPLVRPAFRREISVTEVCARLAAAAVPGTAAGIAAGAADCPGPRPGSPSDRYPFQDSGEQLPSLPVDAHLSGRQLENSFGTLTHQLLGAALRDPDRDAETPEWGRLGIPAELREACLAGARSLVSGFLGSELGVAARNAREIEIELPFVHLWQDGVRRLYISGQIDAVLDTPEGLTLIDFKTDRVYREGEHACQLGLYALALGELTGRDIRAYLFLLRPARTVPMTYRFDWPELFRSLRL